MASKLGIFRHGADPSIPQDYRLQAEKIHNKKNKWKGVGQHAGMVGQHALESTQVL